MVEQSVAEGAEHLESRITTLEQQLETHEQAASQQAKKLEEANTLLRRVLDSMGDGVLVMNEVGKFTLSNPAALRILRVTWEMLTGDLGPEAFAGIFHPDRTTPYAIAELPMMRALRGEEVAPVDLFIQTSLVPEGMFLSMSARPIPRDDGTVAGAVAVFHDATERRRLRSELEAQNRALAESEEAQAKLVEKLRLAVDDLSTPILDLWEGVLALPIVGLIDSSRAAQVMERLLHEVVRRRPSFVILDVTGVGTIDTSTAGHFIKMMGAVKLLGCQCLLAGIQPDMANTLVSIGVDFGAVRTCHSLQQALRLCMRELEGDPRQKRRARAT